MACPCAFVVSLGLAANVGGLPSRARAAAPERQASAYLMARADDSRPDKLREMRTLVVLAVLLIPAVACAAQGRIDKASLTPAQKKIDSDLLEEIHRADPGDRAGTVAGRIRIDDQDRTLIDIRVDVTPAIRQTITDLDGTIVSVYPEYRSVVAWVPLAKIETLADEQAVTAIRPNPEPLINR